MKTLNGLTKMTDGQIQDWLRRVHMEADGSMLSKALLRADDAVKDCIFRNMSAQARTAVEDSIHQLSAENLKESDIQTSTDSLVRLM